MILYVFFQTVNHTFMANKRQSKEKRPLILAALCEGTPMRAVARMFKTDKKRIGRVIRETGEAFADYMDKNFRDLPCVRIEMDEQWQYVGAHGSRLISPKTSAAIFGFGVASTPIRNWSFRTRSESATGGPETALLRTFATA
jgi:hypothetical protein